MNADNPANAMLILLATLEDMETPDNRVRWSRLRAEGLQFPVVLAGIPIVAELFCRLMAGHRIKPRRRLDSYDRAEIAAHYAMPAISDAIAALDRLNGNDKRIDSCLIDPVIQFTVADIVYSLNRTCKQLRAGRPSITTAELTRLVSDICYDQLIARRVHLIGGDNSAEPLGIHEESNFFTVRGAPLLVYLKDHHNYTRLYGRDKFSVDMIVTPPESISRPVMQLCSISLAGVSDTVRLTGALSLAMKEYVNSKIVGIDDNPPSELGTPPGQPDHPGAQEKPYTKAFKDFVMTGHIDLRVQKPADDRPMTKAMFESLQSEGKTVESSTFLDDIKLSGVSGAMVEVVGIERLNRLGGGHSYLVYHSGSQVPVSVDDTSTVEQLYNELKRQ